MWGTTHLLVCRYQRYSVANEPRVRTVPQFATGKVDVRALGARRLSQVSQANNPQPESRRGAAAFPLSPQPNQQPPARSRRQNAVVLSATGTLLIGAIALFAPTPYVLESPGPTYNTLSEIDGQSLIQINGTETFDTDGSLNLTTVYVAGGPSGTVNAFDALGGWLNPAQAVTPEDFIYAPQTTADQISQQNQADMTSSQELAVAAALRELDVPITEMLTIAVVVPDLAADGIAQIDDVIRTVNGTAITSLDQLRSVLNDADGAPVSLGVTRGGGDMDLTVTPTQNEQGDYQLGVQIRQNFQFPFEVNIGLENVGGPSAGSMFALGIIDKLTPGSMTGGQQFAGTGTITADGNVGPIGGIRQKMVGAKNDGASYFLAPSANCIDVVGHIPEGLSVVSVSTLSEAVDAVTRIGEGTEASSLPQCE